MTLDRRTFLKGSGLAFLGLGVSPAFLTRAAAASAPGGKVLVALFQRGAVDGLAMVPPVGDVRYAPLRPTIALGRPGSGDGAAIALDEPFGLHPSLAPLVPYWNGRSLAVVHAVGSPSTSRSHFDAQDFLEAGTPDRKSTADGWLNRALGTLRSPAAPFRAIGLQPALPRSLAGPAPAVALASVSDFALKGGRQAAPLAESFESMYAGAVDVALRTTGAETFDSMRLLAEANPARFAPENGASYPVSPLGKRLKEIVQLIRADVGLEVVATDCGGWDTHAGQGGATGQLANRLGDLGSCLAAFAQDLGDRLADVCVVTMTEFGRTVRENGTRGTDHGHGSVMLVLGGGVKGGRVLGRWKGLADDALFEGRDLAVTTDHREVLSEVLSAQLKVTDLSTVFPGYRPPTAGRLAIF